MSSDSEKRTRISLKDTSLQEIVIETHRQLNAFIKEQSELRSQLALDQERLDRKLNEQLTKLSTEVQQINNAVSKIDPQKLYQIELELKHLADSYRDHVKDACECEKRLRDIESKQGVSTSKITTIGAIGLIILSALIGFVLKAVTPDFGTKTEDKAQVMMMLPRQENDAHERDLLS